MPRRQVLTSHTRPHVGDHACAADHALALAPRRSKFGRLALAALSLVAGGWPGWMLITEQWIIDSYETASTHAGVMPFEQLATAMCSTGLRLLFPVLLLYGATQARDPYVMAFAVALFVIVVTHTIGLVLGVSLIVLGIAGAIAAWVYMPTPSDARPAEAPSSTPEPGANDAALKVLEGVLASHGRELTEEMLERGRRIRELAKDTLARLSPEDRHGAEANSIRGMVAELVPATITKYVALPSDFRVSERLLNGQTAQANTLAQLALVEEELSRVRDGVLQEQGLDVLKHGGYLRSRFQADEALHTLQGEDHQ
jgi:hypothetical protein